MISLHYAFSLFVFVLLGNFKFNSAENAAFQTFLSEFERLKSKVERLEHEVSRVAELEEKLKTYKQQIVSQNERIASLSQELEMLLSNRDSTAGGDVAEEQLLRMSNTSSSDVDKQTAGKSESYTPISLRRGVRGLTTVAFTAVFKPTNYHMSLNSVVKFSKIILNDGNGYDHSTGVFTAPTAGTYLFNYQISRVGEIGQSWVELLVNGVHINAGASDMFHASQDVQGGNSAVLRLRHGDDVWLRTFHADDVTIHGTYGFSCFSGVLLY